MQLLSEVLEISMKKQKLNKKHESFPQTRTLAALSVANAKLTAKLEHSHR